MKQKMTGVVHKVTLEQLKEQARAIADVPEHYALEIEDFMQNEAKPESGEAMFVWSDPETGEGILVTLGKNGDLIDLTVDREGEENTTVRLLPLSERQKRAEQFMTKHYPEALKLFHLTHTNEKRGAVQFTYEQKVMGLPLPHSGCDVKVNDSGDIVGFTYHGEKPAPDVPAELVSKESLRQHVADSLDLRLQVACLHEEIYEGGNGKWRLVYEPLPRVVSFRADDGKPLSGGSDEEGEYVSFEPLPELLPDGGISHGSSIEQLIGVDESQLERVRELDMGDQLGVVWRDRKWRDDTEDRSLKGFFDRRTQDTVKAMIDKKSGRLCSFMWFAERNGDLALTREECLHIALSFLQQILPEPHRYLRLKRWSDEETDSRREMFTFRLYAGNVPVYLQYVQICVNRTTGYVDHFTGMDIDPTQLDLVPTSPEVERETAKAHYLQALDFKLAWQKDDDKGEDAYMLVYKLCHRDTQKTIPFIDAVTGEVICEQ